MIMSEAMHGSPVFMSGMRSARAERTTTSCGECRRRKQKCNRGQPCSNCARRFPPPPCEYRTRRSSTASSKSPQEQAQQPPFAITVLPPSLSDNSSERYEIQGTREPLLPPRRQPSPFGPRGSTSNRSPSAGGRDVTDLLGIWSGFGLTGNQLPPLMLGSSPPQHHHQQGYSPNVAWGRSPSPASASSPGGPIICDEDGTMHSDVVHDAAKLLVAFRGIPDRFIVDGPPSSGVSPGGSSSWTPEIGNLIQQQQQQQQQQRQQRQQQWDSSATAMMLDHVTLPGGGDGSNLDISGIWPFVNPNLNSQKLGGQGQQPQGLVRQMSMDISPQEQGLVETRDIHQMDLLRIYVKLISRFKASIDGNPDSSNPYMKYHVPYCVQSPLLQHVAIYTAAGLLSQTGHLEGTVAMSHKGHAIKLLNEHLRSRASTSDEGIAGVVQLIVNEWYWGETNDLRAHLRGLREMIKLRGGFRTLGLHGLISKLAITADVSIALSFEISPFLRGGSEFDFQDATSIPLRLSLNTPLMSPLVQFSSCDEALRIHSRTASILDDMRFLISAVLALPEDPSQKELQKVNTTAEWINKRIASLPETSPTAQQDASTEASSTLSPTTIRGRGTSEGADELRPPANNHQHVQPRRRSFQSTITTPTATATATSAIPPSSVIDPSLQASSSPSPPSDDLPPDHIYQAVRLAALIYSRAIMLRKPFSQTITTDEFLHLWTTAWRVPLVTWRGLLGVLNWLLLPLLSRSGKSAAGGHNLYMKALGSSCLLQMGMDNWEICRGVMNHSVRLQGWLRGGDSSESYNYRGSSGDGSGSEEFEYNESEVGGGGGDVGWRRGSGGSGSSGSERVRKGKNFEG